MDKKNTLLNVLKKHHAAAKRRLAKHKKAYAWIKEKGLGVAELRERSQRLLTAGTLAGSLLLSPGVSDIQKLTTDMAKQVYASEISGDSVRVSLAAALAPILPDRPQPLTPSQEQEISRAFQKYLGINAVANLEGNHLNTTYGYTGAEQHLARFPGDSIYQHDEQQQEGMAPGLGAWGYFGSSAEDALREKYYIAAQTLYLPDWNTNQPYLKNWYKYRKILMVNPKNGKAVVGVIGDAGPADWTGKQFGASPEIMHDLNLDFGMKKGEVIVFFVNDPENKIPLGPIDYGNIKVRI